MADTQNPLARPWQVFDLNASNGQPRLHEIEGRKYALTADTPTDMPQRHALLFLKDKAFRVLDADGNEIPTLPEVEVPDPRRPRIGMQKGEVVARLVELTPVALRARAALRPGGHAFTEDSPVEDIIRFLMSAPSIAQAGSSASGRYDAGEEILEGDGIGHAATAEMLGAPRVATARSNGASFTMGG